MRRALFTLLLVFSLVSCHREDSSLAHFRERVAAEKDLGDYTLDPQDPQRANDALDHRFFVLRAHEPLCYGEDIDWTYNPYGEDEMRWQLHRRYWFRSLARMFAETHDERYAAAWREQFLDWWAKNPLPEDAPVNTNADLNLAGDPFADVSKWPDENSRFAWRPLEVSSRIGSSVKQFFLTIDSEGATDEFVEQFMEITRAHGNFLHNHYSAVGNHRLFEADAMLYLATSFPEFKESGKWKKKAVRILTEEITRQVYPDGVQKELDPHYHIEMLDLAKEAIDAYAGKGVKFSREYLEMVHKMESYASDITLPDGYQPLWGDNRRGAHAKRLAKENHMSSYYPDGGVCVLRTGWDSTSTVMILKAGGPAGWHNQPDNGTFELYFAGRNIMPDSGCYMYGGDSTVLVWRNWFRQTMVHKTLTLDNRNYDVLDARFVDVEPQSVVLENYPYAGLAHMRSVAFSGDLITIRDEAGGDAEGTVAIHYQFPEDATLDVEEIQDGYVLRMRQDRFDDIILQITGENIKFAEEEGWVSYEYGTKYARKAVSFSAYKTKDSTVRFTTIISK